MVCNLINQEIRRYPSGDGFTSVPPDVDPGGDAPAAITDLAVNASSTSALLTWTANGGTISVYRRNVTAGGSFALITSGISGGSTSYNETGLTPETEYQWRITSTNEYGTSPNSNTVSATTDAVSAPGDWQLAAGHFEGYEPLALIYPRPSAETNSTARHRVNYTGQKYEIPLICYGGKRPLYGEVTGPAGMYITQYIDHGRDVMVLHCDDLPAGTHDISITIQDQDLESVSVSWQVVVSTNWNVLDGSAATNGIGTLASPFNTVNSIIDGRPTLVTGGPVDWDDKTIPTNQMSRTWLSVDGSRVQMLAASSETGATGGSSDFYFGGFEFRIPTDRRNIRQIFRWDGASRSIFYDNIFDGNNEGTVGSPENASMVMWTNQGVAVDSTQNGWYCSLHSNVFRNVRARDTYIGYSQRYMVCQNNVMENCQDIGGGHGFYPKTNVRHFGFYENYTAGDANTMKILRIDGYSGNFLMDHYDVCYNNIRFFGSDSSGDGTGAISCSHEFTGTVTERYFYRNNIYAPNSAPFHARGLTSGTVLHYSNNVTMSNTPAGGSFSNGVHTVQYQGTLDIQGAQHGNNASGLLDSSNNLAGAALANLGLKGSQIS